jgi:hypothetical protein
MRFRIQITENSEKLNQVAQSVRRGKSIAAIVLKGETNRRRTGGTRNFPICSLQDMVGTT